MKYLILVLSFFTLSAFHPIPEHEGVELSKQAQTANKNIAVYFSGSDWCVNCYGFKKKYLEQESIKTILDNDFVYYNADFPQRKKLAKEIVAVNEALAEKLNPEGIFPLLVIADAQLNILSIIAPGEQTDAVYQKIESKKIKP